MNAEEPLRIGNAERTAAMKALDEHLTAGRLGVEEYADRSAAAANAVVATDLAALFTDLPEPHPRLPGRPPAPVTPPGRGVLDIWGPWIVPIAVLVAIGLFLTVRAGPVFVLIPLAAVLFWAIRHR
jgi:hypothetical protein